MSARLCLLIAWSGWCIACGIGTVDGAADEPPEVGQKPTPLPPRGNEVCSDGIDNDGDKAVDEGCNCTVSTSAEKACYPGPPETRGRGQCKDGAQVCVATGEFGSWGECVGAVMPQTEVCGDGVDNDCNGKVDDDPSCACAASATRECYSAPSATNGVGQCTAGTQHCKPDGTGWSECVGEVGPAAEQCDDGIDNDCDGQTDEGCIAKQQPLGCTTQTMKFVSWQDPEDKERCGPNQAVYMMDDGNSKIICCPLPATDILSKLPSVERSAGCGGDEVITGVASNNRFHCTRINTTRYSLGPHAKPCYFGSGWAGFWGVQTCSGHPGSFSVLQKQYFGSDGCSGYPYGSLFVSQTGRECKDMSARRLLYKGTVAGDPPAGTPVVMFK